MTSDLKRCCRTDHAFGVQYLDRFGVKGARWTRGAEARAREL